MRILTVFIMSFVVSLFGVLLAAFPQLWLNAQPWASPLFWGGAVVLAVWWYSLRSLTTEYRTETSANGSGGVAFVTLAAVGTGLLMYWLA